VVIVSPFGELIVSLTQVLIQNATVFKQTAAMAAERIQAEAAQNAASEFSPFLTKVANALQQSAQTGELPKLDVTMSPTTLAYNRVGQPDTSLSVTGPTALTSTSIDQLFSTLASQASAVAQSDPVDASALMMSE
jgi:hypothetical protein